MWVDDIENPNIALVYSFAVGGFSIVGEPRDLATYHKLEVFMKKEMFPQLKSKGVSYFEFSIESKAAKPYILEFLKNGSFQSEDEYKFRRNIQFEKSISIPEGYLISKVDIKFLARLKDGHFANHEFLSERLLESWSSYESFMCSSVAFVAVLKRRIVAVIIGTARFGKIISIDIETEKNHRNKGLAFILTQYFVNECIDNELLVQWDCMASNKASLGLARKANFQFLKKDKVYWFEI